MLAWPCSTFINLHTQDARELRGQLPPQEFKNQATSFGRQCDKRRISVIPTFIPTLLHMVATSKSGNKWVKSNCK